MRRLLIFVIVAALLALGVYLFAREGSPKEDATAGDRPGEREIGRQDEDRAREIVGKIRAAREKDPDRTGDAPVSGEAASQSAHRETGQTEDRREERERAREAAWAAEVVRKLQSATPAALITYLEDDDPRVRQATMQMLADRGAAGENVVRALIPRLADNWEPARRTAVRALAAIGEPAIPALTEALGSEDSLLSENATEALGRIGR